MGAGGKIGLQVIPCAFEGNRSGVAGFAEGLKEGAKIFAGFAGEGAAGEFGGVGVFNQMSVAGDFGGGLGFLEHVIEIGKEADIGMGALLDGFGALGEGVDEIAFAFVERLYDEGDGVVLRDGGQEAQEADEIVQGLRMRVAIGDDACGAAAKDDGVDTDAAGAGEGGPGVAEQTIRIDGGADAFEGSREEAVG